MKFIHKQLPYALALVIRAESGITAAETSLYRKLALPENDLDALSAIYDATNGDNWFDNSNWHNGQDPCTTNLEWAGIICNSLAESDHHEVIGLALTNNNLSGELPTEIGILDDLITIEVDNNPNLGGSLPSEIGMLSNLKLFMSNGASFSGEFPSTLGMLTEMWMISVEGNQVEGSLPDSIVNLVNLAWLTIGGTDITGTIPCDHFESIGTTVSLDCDQLLGSPPLLVCSCCGCDMPTPTKSPVEEDVDSFPALTPVASTPTAYDKTDAPVISEEVEEFPTPTPVEEDVDGFPTPTPVAPSPIVSEITIGPAQSPSEVESEESSLVSLSFYFEFDREIQENYADFASVLIQLEDSQLLELFANGLNCDGCDSVVVTDYVTSILEGSESTCQTTSENTVCFSTSSVLDLTYDVNSVSSLEDVQSALYDICADLYNSNSITSTMVDNNNSYGQASNVVVTISIEREIEEDNIQFIPIMLSLEDMELLESLNTDFECSGGQCDPVFLSSVSFTDVNSVQQIDSPCETFVQSDSCFRQNTYVFITFYESEYSLDYIMTQLILYLNDFYSEASLNSTIDEFDESLDAVQGNNLVSVDVVAEMRFLGEDVTLLNETELEIYSNETFDFLVRLFTWNDPPLSMQSFLVGTQELGFVEESTGDFVGSERKGSGRDTDDSLERVLVVPFNATATYIPPPEVDFDKIIVEKFTENESEYIESLSIFSDQSELSIDVSAAPGPLSTQQDLSPASQEEEEEEDSSESSDSVFHPLTDVIGVLLIIACFFVSIAIFWFLRKSNKEERIQRDVALNNEELKRRTAENFETQLLNKETLEGPVETGTID